MENNNNVKSSCLMLAASLNTPVSLGAIFEANDLKDTGIEYDSHITVLYARKDLSRQTLLSDIDFLAINDKGQSISDILKIEKKEEDFAIGRTKNRSLSFMDTITKGAYKHIDLVEDDYLKENGYKQSHPSL